MLSHIKIYSYKFFNLDMIFEAALYETFNPAQIKY